MWALQFTSEAADDLKRLDGSQRNQVASALERVRINPLPVSEGGYGKPLGNKFGFNLTGLLKIKLRSSGIRIVYKLERIEGRMVIIVIGMRKDEEVYREAAKRQSRT